MRALSPSNGSVFLMTLLGELTGRDGAGGDWTETIAGRELRLMPLALADWAVVEARLVAGRRDPIAIARESLAALPITAHRTVLESALSEACRGNQVTIDELAAFASTATGTVLMMWLALRTHQPDLSEADVAQLLSRWTDADRAAAEPRLAGVPPEGSNPAKNS
jgi:hypothetical protein